VDIEEQELVELCKQIRSVSVAPLLLLLPTYNEKLVLSAYQYGMDDVVIKPISPVVFLAKIKAWSRHTWTVPVEELNRVKAGRHRLDALKRCLIDSQDREINLTNLEFHFLHLLMNRSGEIISTEELVQSIWGGYGGGDQILLKNVVYRLRKKIETNPGKPVHLITWPGGYSFQE